MSKQKLKILMLEDSNTDAELIQRLLKKEMPEAEICLAMTEAAFHEEVRNFKPDVLLADNSLPGFSASEALKYTRMHLQYAPFIMVTGTVSEEFAAGIIKLGADDYILKDRLIRLPNAIETALKQRAMEKEKQEAQQKLIRSESKYRSLFEHSPLPMLVYSLDTLKYLDVNDAAISHYGYSREEFLNMDTLSIRPQDEQIRFLSKKSEPGEGPRMMGQWKHIKKDGSVILVNIFSHDITYNDIPARVVIIEDITERSRTEESLKLMEKEMHNRKLQEQKKISRAIIKAQEKERNYIGRELHDNVNQILAGTKIYLRMAVRDNDELAELIKYPLELIDNSINEIRLLSSRSVTPLKDIQLEQLLVDLTSVVKEATNANVHLEYDLPESSIDDDLKLNLYRIIQEQMNNIIKYAEASEIGISINAVEKQILLIISDNGKGFDVNKKRKGIGISNIINRIETFNGKVIINSSPGSGCRIQITVPDIGTNQ